MGKVKGLKEKSLEEDRKLFYRGEMRKNESDFALKLFKQIAARGIEDLSRSIEH